MGHSIGVCSLLLLRVERRRQQRDAELVAAAAATSGRGRQQQGGHLERVRAVRVGGAPDQHAVELYACHCSRAVQQQQQQRLEHSRRARSSSLDHLVTCVQATKLEEHGGAVQQLGGYLKHKAEGPVVVGHPALLQLVVPAAGRRPRT